MLKLMLIVVSLLAAGLMFAIARKPAHFRIQRSTRIGVPREKLFAYVSDLHNFDAWSPWAQLDPAMRKTHFGAASGVGAGYEWQGNNKVGHGRMEIVEAVAPERVLIKLDFLKPFEAHNMAEYLLVERDGETEFTWAMFGPNNFTSKAMSLFFNMDKMVGAQFEQGLRELKTVAERAEA
jgi:uncharacterized protein YndB with AHSA1/START domain